MLDAECYQGVTMKFGHHIFQANYDKKTRSQGKSTSGVVVPQGNVLSPVLYFLGISDIIGCSENLKKATFANAQYLLEKLHRRPRKNVKTKASDLWRTCQRRNPSTSTAGKRRLMERTSFNN